jgi:hypothetical protein
MLRCVKSIKPFAVGLVSILVTACTSLVASPPIPLVEESPLSEFFISSVWQNAYEVERLILDLTLHREELIAQCMLDAGFHYIPDLGSQRFIVSGIVFDETRPDDREWVTLYGFGVGTGKWPSSNSDRIVEDPNAAFLASLSETKQAAFLSALNGPLDNFPDSGMRREEWAEFQRSRGCWGKSHQQSMEESPLFMRHQSEFSPLFDALNETWNAVASSPEIRTLYGEWGNCFTGRGFPGFSSPGDAANFIAILHSEYQTFKRQEASPELRELTLLEIDMALADLDCRESINFRIRRNALFFDAEYQFLSDHRSALEAYRAFVEQGN